MTDHRDSKRTQNSEVLRILNMLSQRKIDAHEAQLLLQSVSNRTRRRDYLANPFDFASTSTCFVVAIVIAILSVALARVGIIFDGILDVHRLPEPASYGVAVVAAFMNWPIVAGVLYGVARALCGNGRARDMFAFVGAARLPLFLLAILTLGVEMPTSLDPQALDGAFLAIALLVILPLWISHVYYLHSAFRTAGTLAKSRANWAFLASVLVLEVLSKYVMEMIL